MMMSSEDSFEEKGARFANAAPCHFSLHYGEVEKLGSKW